MNLSGKNIIGTELSGSGQTFVGFCHAMVHGAPFSATTAPSSTSVGTLAINRFSRGVCFQNFPDSLLPDELKNFNSLGIWRLIDGNWTKNSC